MNWSASRGAGSLASVLCLALVGAAAGAVPAGAAEPPVDTSGNTLLAPVHTDMAPVLGADGELDLVFHQDDGNRDPATTVVEVPDTALRTVPAGSGGSDYDFMGPVGSSVWILPEVQQDGLAWLGWSSQRISTDDYVSPLAMRFEGVVGIDGGDAPGHLVLSDSFADYGEAPLASTREGLPRALTMAERVHKHLNWTFTAPGTYCLGVAVAGTLADGRSSSTTSVLTFIVGQEPGLDPTTVETCEQRGVETTGASVVEPDRDGYSAPRLVQPLPPTRASSGTNAYATLQPRLNAADNAGGTPSLGLDLIEGTQVDGGIAHDPAATVIAIDASRKSYLSGRAYWPLDGTSSLGPGGATTLYWDTTRLSADGVDGPVRWRLSDMAVPGQFTFRQYGHGTGSDSFTWSTLEGSESDAFETPVGWGNYFTTGRFFGAGVYCLDIELTGTHDTAQLSATSTLTFAVALDRPELVTSADCGLTADEFEAAHTPVAPAITATLNGGGTYGSDHRLRLRVSAGADPAGGTATVALDGATIGQPTLAAGEATIALPRSLQAGEHRVTVSYPGGTTSTGAPIEPAQTTVPVRISQAATRLKVALKRLRGERVRATARVLLRDAPGVPATGRVTVHDGKRKLTTIRLGTRAKRSTVIRLDPGQHRLRFRYAGTTNLLGAHSTERVRIRPRR